MSDEEKKAIELTKTIVEFAGDSYIPKENRKALQVLLNLIEKQQKEIEELKEVKWYYEISRVSKDRIKAKMKENEWSLENYDCDESDSKQSQAIGAWIVLQSLLEEE